MDQGGENAELHAVFFMIARAHLESLGQGLHHAGVSVRPRREGNALEGERTRLEKSGGGRKLHSSFAGGRGRAAADGDFHAPLGRVELVGHVRQFDVHLRGYRRRRTLATTANQ